MNKKGVTFIELLIYMALLTVISLLIGRLFNSLVDNYSSGRRVVKQQTDIRDIIDLMSREIRNTGLKTYLTGTGPFTMTIADDIIIEDNTDSSSFYHGQSSDDQYGDTLKIKKIVLDNNGDYVTSDTSLMYYLDGTTLKWELKTTAGSPSTINNVIAENVYALQFEYGILGSNVQLFDENPITEYDWDLPDGNNPVDITGATTGAIKYNSSYQVDKNQKYRVLLDITPSGGFPDALDYLSLAFVTGAGSDLGSEKFLPHTGTMEITVPIHTSGIAYPTLEYKTTGSGSLTINGIEAHCTQQDTYTWSFNPDVPDKKFVRAIRVSVLTRSSGNTNSKSTGPITVGDVEVERTGEYTWRLYTELIETPNNGVF